MSKTKCVMLEILCVLLAPIYTAAWVIAHILHLKGREDMETPLEFIFLALDDYYAEQNKFHF